MQEEMEALLNRRWIRKAEDKELYYKIRDQLGEIRKFATEKMGCPHSGKYTPGENGEGPCPTPAPSWESGNLPPRKNMLFSVCC